MKRLPLFKQMVMACGVAVAASLLPSCSCTGDPAVRAEQMTAAAPTATVYSTNGVSDPNVRTCPEVGPLPDNTARALTMWLRGSTVKNFSYVNPQYYIAMPNGKGGMRTWALCSDGQGNLVGVLIPRDGVSAMDLPNLGSYKMYVCDTLERKALSDAIMENLADKGYDAPRINALKSTGLDDERYLISKPLTDTEKQRLEELKKKEEAAAAAAAAAETDSAPAADDTDTTADDSDDTETATPMADADDDTTSADDEDDTTSSDDEDDSTDSDDEE